MQTPSRPYPDVPQQPDFPALEMRIGERWQREGTFRASVEARPKGEGEYVFYDGPPFANGLPHYGHILTGFVKDVVPRYQTMRGRRVERRFGWDCHGLPAEMEVEKRLGVQGRAAIQEYGIERFNAACRASVLEYTGEWRRSVDRMGRWVDFDRDYKTMDLSYMESVLWAFKRLHELGLVYEGHRVMPYSWAAETPVSNFETRIDNSYRERSDPALTVLLPLEPRDTDPGPMALLVWTTTPWTLPSNLAAAVGPEIEYSLVEKDGRLLVLAASARERYAAELADAPERGRILGRDLIGRAYAPPFDYFRGHENAHVVLGADFVSTEDGTGIVHLAPGFGEDDQVVSEANGIRLVCPVDERGRFTAEVADWAGMLVFDANKPIAQALKARGLVLRHEQVLHSYPHCWRTDQPLIYRAMSSWYVEVTRIRERMVELNQSIRWTPEHVRDGQFGKWLEGARDWSISRNRFWGTPIPVWRSDDPAYPRIDVYGSLDELERDFGVRPADLHRPAIDALTRPNPDDPTGKSTMRRVEDVLDCWFESGSMPFAQVHYPFENREWFESHFPADFIVEYVAQTRGWFYTLMVLGTALFDRPPFRNVICHGVVVAEDGQKLSKRLRNYADPDEVFSKHGADAMRWYLMASPVLRGGDLAISRDGAEFAEVARQVLLPIWNAYYFFTLYANADGVKAKHVQRAEGALDRYALARTRRLVEEVQRALDAYDLAAACAEVRAYLEALNNWYIRRSRPRFWAPLGADGRPDADKQAAYDTLYTALSTLARTVAPLLPYLAEELWSGLVGEVSVHLADWPRAEELPEEAELVAAMERVRAVCSATLGLREEHRLRVRLPLPELVVAGERARELEPFGELLRDELNVKSVRFSGDLEAFGSFHIDVQARALGPRLGARTKEVIAAAKAGAFELAPDGAALVAGERLEPEREFRLSLRPAGGLEGRAVAALGSNDMLVALDVRVTAELELEGLARDVVRAVQQARRAAGLDIAEAVELRIMGSERVLGALAVWNEFVAGEVLARDLRFGPPEADMHVERSNLDGTELVVGLAGLGLGAGAAGSGAAGSGAAQSGA